MLKITPSLMSGCAALVIAALPASAIAQETSPANPANELAADADRADGGGDEIVVTGTRAIGRSRLDSPSPIDVLSGSSLRQQGTTELGAALATITPSLDLPRSAAVDGTDAIRPATLRGLSPDQTLVLINGIRAHTAALLNVNGSVGRGAAAVDLNTIPTVALDRIEVLRDGASAQYGSDAIAGVINLRLRQASTGGGATVSWGENVTHVDTARGSRRARDGQATTISGWQGFKLGSDGFLTLSGEYLDRNATSRGDFDPRKQPLLVRSRFGDPQVGQYSFYGNAGLPLGTTGFDLYAFGGYQHRNSKSAATPRIAFGTNNDANAAALSGIPGYGDGFLPLIESDSNDLTAAGGVRGEVAGAKVDLSLSYGRNRIGFHTDRSGNATYGVNSPTRFYDGALTYDQLVGNLNVSRELPLGQGTLNIAAGGEYRRESFKIGAGQPESYNRGPLGANTTLTSGAQGFIGFQPSNVVDVHRDNVSAYVDLEAKPIDGLDIDIAGRAERYSDFGHTETGKISARYDLTRWFALRGTFATGFRAPSLQQQYFTSTASVLLTGGGIAETGTFPSVSPVGAALGGKALEPEKARNYSAGAVLRFGGVDVTVDAYRIRIRNQLALSENISGASITPLLAPYGVTQARFFINGITSTTKGIDVVAHYRLATGSAGTFDLTGAGNFNDVKINRVPAAADIGLGSTITLFSRQRIISFEQGTPRTKLVGTVDWSLRSFGVTARLSHYGDVTQPSSNGFAADDIHTGRHNVADLEARYTIRDGLTAAIGANNLFDVYPDYVRVTSSRGTALNSTGLVGFPYYSPFGFNGRFVYGRISVAW